MRQVSCANCGYWNRYSKDDDRGECRRHSPVYNLHGTSRWPQTIETDWCGDFLKRDLTNQKEDVN